MEISLSRLGSSYPMALGSDFAEVTAFFGVGLAALAVITFVHLEGDRNPSGSFALG